MMSLFYALAASAVLLILYKLFRRLQLSKAKHPSLRGHAKISRRLAKLLPFYEFADKEIFCTDGAPPEVERRRRNAFDRLCERFAARAPLTVAASEALEGDISDVMFINHYRVPFQFRNFVRRHLKVGTLADATDGVRIRDLDGNWAYDVSGSYGVNIFGYDFYRECMEKGAERVRELGPVLGPYHPLIAENVTKLKQISGMDEVSFHMSGTEAVMQAVRLSLYHTGRDKTVVFCGSYHGWWDGVQPGVGNHAQGQRRLYAQGDEQATRCGYCATRKDIACVLVNPLQALHPNAGAPGDATLVASDRSAHFDQTSLYRLAAGAAGSLHPARHRADLR